MTLKIFLIWCLFFISELNEKRKKLAIFQGNKALTQPCFLILDGHKSRLNGDALEILYLNNIRVIVLPAHSSHLTQPFDVGLASPLKNAFKNQSVHVPKYLEKKLKNYTETAQKRFIRVISILDAWKKSSTYNNISSAWSKSGICPFNPDEVLESQYVRELMPDETIPTSKCKIEINGFEITSFEKRLEISRHHHNIATLLVHFPVPQFYDISNRIRKGKEKLLSSDCIFLINLGYGYTYYRL